MIKMKKSLLIAISALLVSSSAFAYLPVSAVTTMALPVYGIYTSSDPTCMTGMIATVALTKTSQTINFASNPTIGSGALPATIGCVVIVVGDSLSNAWAAGTYTTTSTGGGGSPVSDSSCNAGGSNTGQKICNNGTPTWPAQITADAAAIGLTLKTTSCSSGTTSDVVPLVLSTNSICTGQPVTDAAVTACNGGNINNFAMPTSAADASNGTKLTAPSAAGNLKFVVNPTNTLGGSIQNSVNTCGNIAAPLFSFAVAN